MEWLNGYAVFDWIATWANPVCDVFFRAVTDLGSSTFYYLSVASLFWVADRRKAVVLFLLLLAGWYVNAYAKLWFATPRPDPTLARVLDLRPIQTGSNAFPSGHMQAAIIFWGYLSWWVRRRWFTGLTLMVMGLIGFSRLYLAVHFPIDILGGAVLGILTLSLIAPLERWAAHDCYTPRWSMLVIATGTLVLAVSGDPAVAMTSGSLVGLLLGASWLPQRPLATRTWRQKTAVVIVGLTLQIGLAASLGSMLPKLLFLTYLQIALLWVFALWVYPRLVLTFWPRLSPAGTGASFA